jgi:lysophospholipase L1-like esterase
MFVPVIWSQPLRDAYLLTLQRYFAPVIRPPFVFTGDSMTANTNWGWALARNPLAAVNLAAGGATIHQIAWQVSKAGNYHGKYLFVTAGTNDILTDRSLSQIRSDFASLLEQVPKGMKVIVTLIPYTSSPEHRDAIRTANLDILKLVSNHDGVVVIDINPLISVDGILEARYTVDGVHFNRDAYNIWTEQLRKVLNL